MSTEKDNINPEHYKFSNGAEVIDISENLTSNGGQIVQYVSRATRFDGNVKGNPLEDLRKAKWFIEREIRRLEEIQRLKAEAEGGPLQNAFNMSFTLKPEFDGQTAHRLLFGLDDGSWEAMDGYISVDGIDAAAEPIDVEPEAPAEGRPLQPGDRVRASDDPYWLNSSGQQDRWYMENLAGKVGIIEERQGDVQWYVDWGDELSLFVHEDCLTLVEEEDANGSR